MNFNEATSMLMLGKFICTLPSLVGKGRGYESRCGYYAYYMCEPYDEPADHFVEVVNRHQMKETWYVS